MTVLIKRGGILVEMTADSIKRSGALVTPSDLMVKRAGAMVSALAPAVRRKASIIGSPMVGQPLLFERAVFYGSTSAVLTIFMNGVSVATGSYTPQTGDVGKTFYVDDVGTNGYGSVHSISTSRVCVPALDTPVLLDSGDGPLSNYVFSGNTNTAVDTTGMVQGTGRIRMTGTGNGTNTTMTATRTISAPDTSVQDVLVYCSSKTAASLTSGTGLNITRSGLGNTVNFSDSATKYLSGNHWLAAHISEFPALPAGAGNMVVKESIQQVSPFTVPADGTFEALYCNGGGRPTVVLTVDDWTASAYLNLFQWLRLLNIPCTFFIPSGQVGNAGKSSWAQAREMEDSGVAEFGTNTRFDLASSTFATPMLYGDDLVQCRADCLTNGLSARGLYMLALSNGQFTEPYIAELVSRGWLMGRTTEPQGIHTRFGFGNVSMTMPSYSITGSVTLAAAIAQVELAKLRKQTQIFHTHDISDAPQGIGWQMTAKMIPFLYYLAAEQAAGRIDLLTMSQLNTRDRAAVAP